MDRTYGLWQNSGVDWVNLGNGFVFYSPAELLNHFWLPCLIFTSYFFFEEEWITRRGIFGRTKYSFCLYDEACIASHDTVLLKSNFYQGYD